MRKELINDALSEMDIELIEGYYKFKDSLAERPKKAVLWGRLVPLAAVLAVLICAALMMLPLFGRFTPPISKDTEDGAGDLPAYDPPLYDEAYLSALEAAGVFAPYSEGAAINAYTKVFSPETRPISAGDVPEGGYADIYGFKQASAELDRREFEDFVNDTRPKILSALGMELDEFETYEKNYDGYVVSNNRGGGLVITISQHSDDIGVKNDINKIRISLEVLTEGEIKLGGEAVQIDQRQSDSEILASFEPTKEKLFDLFGCTFDSSEIRFNYDGESEFGANMVALEYYNRADILRTEGITVLFTNFDEGLQSADILKRCSIEYRQARVAFEEYCERVARCALISLEEAEAQLAAGYVFGGHSCEACMSMQERVSFDEYDLVGFEYVAGESRAVPFYTFYKDIGKTANGNTIYAKVYVCAVRLSGLEEYFAGQRDAHDANIAQ